MLSLPGFPNLSLLQRNLETLGYRSVRSKDGTWVSIYRLRPDSKSMVRLAAYQQTSKPLPVRPSSPHLSPAVSARLDQFRNEAGKSVIDQQTFKSPDITKDLDALFSLNTDPQGMALGLLSTPDSRHYVGDTVIIAQILTILINSVVKFNEPTDLGVTTKAETVFGSLTHPRLPITDTDCGTRLLGRPQTVESSDPGSSGHQQGDAEPRWRHLAGIKILLVEDSKFSQVLSQEILSSLGLIVTVADHGRAALQQLAHGAFDVILMDLQMPVMNGHETIKALRADQRYRDMQVIALSAGTLGNEADQALAESFDQYVAKPIDFDRLLTLISNLVGPTRSAGSTVDIHQEPADTVAQIQSVRDIDFAVALQHHNGDQALLNRLLVEFERLYADADQQLLALTRANDGVSAERLAHNIKGVAGSFGARQLMACAQHIEQQLLCNGELHAGLQAFTFALTNFNQASQRYRLVATDSSH